MQHQRHSPRDNRGFTLIEVLVAFTITAIALGVLLRGIASSLRTAHEAALWNRAVAMAESQLDKIVDPASLLGERYGSTPDGWRWRTRVAFVAAAAAPNPRRGGSWALGTGLYRVSVTVFWSDGGAEQYFELDSARLGPVSGYRP